MDTTTSTFDPLVRVRDLSISFRLDKHTTFEAVKGISFDIPRNTTVALVGESGSGKSVTSLAILGLAAAGELDRRPEEPDHVRRPQPRQRCRGASCRTLRGADISMIFQEPMTSLNPVFTVGFQIEEVLRLHMGLTGAQARKRAIELLDRSRHSRARAAHQLSSRRRCRAASSSA